MTSQVKLKNTASQYQIEERRRQVSVMVAQGMTEVSIAKKLGVDNKVNLQTVHLRHYKIGFYFLLRL